MRYGQHPYAAPRIASSRRKNRPMIINTTPPRMQCCGNEPPACECKEKKP